MSFLGRILKRASGLDGLFFNWLVTLIGLFSFLKQFCRSFSVIYKDGSLLHLFLGRTGFCT